MDLGGISPAGPNGAEKPLPRARIRNSTASLAFAAQVQQPQKPHYSTTDNFLFLSVCFIHQKTSLALPKNQTELQNDWTVNVRILPLSDLKANLLSES